MEGVGWLTSVNEISNSNKVDTSLPDALNHVQNKTGDNGPQVLEKKHTWTRLTRMDYGPVDFIKGAKSILGRRVSQGLLHNTKKEEEEGYAGKCGKHRDDSYSDEMTGVFEHPC